MIKISGNDSPRERRKMIQDAATSYEQSVENAETRAGECAIRADEILEKIFDDYIIPEIEYGHFSVAIEDYINKLDLWDAGVRTALFDRLNELGYQSNVTNVAITDARSTTGKLIIMWFQDNHCINGFG